MRALSTSTRDNGTREVSNMRRNIGPWRAAVNVGFALAVLALAGFGIYQVAGRHWRVQPTFRVRAEFPTIGGLEAGHRVRVQGIDAGVVERVVAAERAGPAGRAGAADRRAAQAAGPLRRPGPDHLRGAGRGEGRRADARAGPTRPRWPSWAGSPPSGRSRWPTCSSGPPGSLERLEGLTPLRRAGPGRGQRHRRLDPPRRGQPRQAGAGRDDLPRPGRALAAGRAGARRRWRRTSTR